MSATTHLNRVLRELQREEQQAVRLSGDHEGKVLALGRRALAAVRSALEANKAQMPESPCAIAGTLLFVNIVRNCRAVVHLCASGFDREAVVLNRASVEALITLHFLTEADCDERAKLWGRYAEFTKARLIERNAGPFADVEADRIDAALERGKAVAGDFPNPERWAAKLDVKNLYVMSRGNPTLEWYYDIVYWYGSLHTHSNAAALDELLSVNQAGQPTFRLSLGVAEVRREMALALGVLLNALGRIKDKLQYEIEMQSLIDDYVEVFGQRPGPAEM